MPSVGETANEELGGEAIDGCSTQHDRRQQFSSPPAGIPGADLNDNNGTLSTLYPSVEGRGKPTAGNPITGSAEVDSGAIPTENGTSEEELGAFDDSHLQVDQVKKKKKKKRSKRPKSKRGLVIHRPLRSGRD
jgi:hypothetical protein